MMAFLSGNTSITLLTFCLGIACLSGIPVAPPDDSLIRCANESDWSNDQCKESILIILKDESQTLDVANSTLIASNCSSSDFTLMQALVDRLVATGNCSPNSSPASVTTAELSENPSVETPIEVKTNPTPVPTTLAVILTESTATPTTTPGKRVVNETMIADTLKYIQSNLTYGCHSSIVESVHRTIPDYDKLCLMFKTAGPALGNSKICSSRELTTLTNIFCHLDFYSGTREIADTEAGRMEQAKQIMKTELTHSCYSIMWPQVIMFEDSLLVGCRLLTLAADTLVMAGTCTQLDIDKLEPVVCYVPPETTKPTLSPSELHKNADLFEVVQNLDPQCNASLFSSVNITESDRPSDLCEVLRSSKDEILKEQTCTEEVFSKLTHAVCACPNMASFATLTVVMSVVLSTFFLEGQSFI